MPNIYHFTDLENLPGILSTGVLRCHRAADCAVDVGDASIKGRRMTKPVTCGPGGVVGDYVPFYFATRSPMLFRIQRGGVDGVSPDPSRLVYLVSSTEAVVEAGLPHVFTDGNAAAAFTDFYEDVAMLDEIVDWPLMRVRMWANTTEDPDRRRRRGAEFLVHGELPLELVHEFGVYDQQTGSFVTATADEEGLDLSVRVRGGWYF